MLYIKTNEHGEITQITTAAPSEADGFFFVEDETKAQKIAKNLGSGVATKMLADGRLVEPREPRPSPYVYLGDSGEWHVPPADMDAHIEHVAVVRQREFRQGIRASINSEVGDVESRSGRMANVLSILVPLALVDVALLDPEDAKDAEKIKQLTELSGGADIRTLAQNLLDDLKAGVVIPCAAVYGLETVLREAMEDSTKAVAILNEAKANAAAQA